jgi:hypothetical protein
MKMVVEVGGAAVSKKDAAELFEDEDDAGDTTTAMLWAATRWFIHLDLPESKNDLWSGCPIREREWGEEHRIDVASRPPAALADPRSTSAIRPRDVDELLERSSRSRQTVAEWCALNGVDEEALARVVETYGTHPDSRTVAICTFQLGYAARARVEPKGLIASSPGEPRYAVQRVVVDTADGSIVAPPTTKSRDADALAASFNKAALEGP